MLVGGLAPNQTNTAIRIEFDDLNLVRLDLQPTFLAGAQDVAPTLQALGTINLTPGQVFSIPLIATDPNGAPITITVDTKGSLPTGTLTGDNTLIFKPTPAQLGSYTFTLIAKQGLLTTSEIVTVNVIPDAITTTRLSGKVNRDKLTALSGAIVEIGGVQTTTNADGSFLIELSTNTATTVQINGVTQQLSQLLGHQLYSGVNNQVGETIYIPTVDTSGSQTNGNLVTNSNLAKVSLKLTTPANSQIGLGAIDSSLIPVDLFTTGTPKSLVAVTTTVTLTTPAKLTLGNDFTVDPGTQMDLWKIDPGTGIATIVGVGKVSADGALIDTISGGVLGAGWYYYVPTPVAQQSPDDNAYNLTSTLDIAPVTVPINSEANLLSGKVTDTYQLQGYQSLGVNQSWQLTYSSERANPDQLVNFQYKAFAGNQNNGVFAKLILKTGDFSIASPNYQWRFNEAPTATTSVDGSLKLDTSGLKSGIYTYDLAIGLNGSGDLNATSQNRTRGTLVHVGKSAFGAGWGLAGLQQIAFNDQQGVITAANLQNESFLLIDGNGTQQIFTVINRANGEIEYGSQSITQSTFKRLADGTFERKLIDGTLYKFDNKGLLTSLKDRHQNETKFKYDPTNDIIQEIIDPVNLTTYFVNNGSRVTQIIDPAGRSTALNSIDSNHLNEITDPDGSKTKWRYNDKNLMTESTDKLGRTGTDTYDNLGKVISAVRKDGSRVDFVSIIGSSADSYIITNSNQINAETVLKTSSVNYSDRARVKSVDGNGNITTTTFDKFGQAIKIEDAIGVKQNVYDTRGLLTQTIDELGNKTSYGYNDKNQVTEIAYGDKLSTVHESPLLYESSTGGGNATATNFIAYGNDTNQTTLVNTQYLITSDKAGNIISRTVDNQGNLVPITPTTPINAYSLRQILGGAYDKLTVKKILVNDFDGDGNQDIAVGYSREVFNNNLTNYLSPYTAFTGGVTAFNGSPTIYTNDAGVLILKGNGDGSFNKNTTTNKIINPSTNRFDVFQFDIADLVAVDFTGDNRPDLAVANFISPGEANWTGENNYQLYLLSNDSTGKFNSAKGNDANNRFLKPFKSVDYKGLLATVKNGNDNLLVVASPNAGLNSSNILIYKSDSLGYLTPMTNYDIPGLVNDIKTADLNGDGVNEIILNAGRIYVIDPKVSLNATNPQASTFTTQNTGFWSFMDVADVNGDGVKDVVVANDNSTLKIFLGDNTGGGMTKFNTAPQIYQGTASPRGLMLKDINGDSRPDIIVGDAFAGFNIKLHTQPSTSIIDAGVVHKSFKYDDKFGQLKESIDELGRKTIYKIDENNGDRLSETHVVGVEDSISGDADDVVINYTYNTRGQILTMKDGNGKITNYTYNPNSNPLGQLSSMTDAAGSTSYYVYDAAGNRTSVIDNEGHRTYFVFDNMSRLRETIGEKPDPSSVNPHTYFDYYLNGQIKEATDANGHKTNYYYDDGLSRLTETTDGEGNPTFTSYDLAGNLDYSIDGRGNRTDYKYDARNRLISATNAVDGTHKDTEYNANDTVKSISDENGNKVKKFYDSRKRLINEVDAANIPTLYNNDDIPLNNSTSYTYDAASQLTGVKNARGKITTFKYDDLGRKTSTISPLNSNGNLTATTAIYRGDFKYNNPQYQSINKFMTALNGGAKLDAAASYGLNLNLVANLVSLGTPAQQ